MHKQHDGKTLEIWLRCHVQTPAAEIKRLTGKSRAAAYTLLNKESFSIAELALVCTLFNLHPADFWRDPRLFVTPYNTKESSVSLDHLSAYYKHNDGFASSTKNESTYAEFIDDFYMKLKLCFQSASFTLTMHDYLGQQKTETSRALFGSIV